MPQVKLFLGHLLASLAFFQLAITLPQRNDLLQQFLIVGTVEEMVGHLCLPASEVLLHPVWADKVATNLFNLRLQIGRVIDWVHLEGVFHGHMRLVRSKVLEHRRLLLALSEVRPEACLHRLSLTRRV